MLATLTALTSRVDGPRDWGADIAVRWHIDQGETVTVRLHNGVLTHVAGPGPAAVAGDVEVALAEAAVRLLSGALSPADLRPRAPARSPATYGG